MYLCKFGQNPSTGSKDITSERSYADADAEVDADGICTKNNMSPTFGWGDIMTKLVGCLTPISTIHFCPWSEILSKNKKYNTKFYEVVLDQLTNTLPFLYRFSTFMKTKIIAMYIRSSSNPYETCSPKGNNHSPESQELQSLDKRNV